ncbi:MAG: hypothetical protein OEZ36_08615 [Spirochaetota bacterium]|nr:hypothetical protein [Spirochaetota bacterium]
MANTFKLSKYICFFLTVTMVLSVAGKSFSAKDSDEDEKDLGEPTILDLSKDRFIEEGKMFPKKLLPPNETEDEYHESSVRRFDIVFFLSMPFFIGYNFLLNQLISSYAKINFQSEGLIHNMQWFYIFVSAAILAAGVATDDYLEISRQEDIKKTMSPAGNSYHYVEPQIRLSWNWQF